MADSPSRAAPEAEAHLLTQPVRFLQSRLQALASLTLPSPSNPLDDGDDDGKADSTRDEAIQSPAPSLPVLQRKCGKTSYYFGHPPPNSRSSRAHHAAPKLLLQLRRADRDHSPVPELEVYSAQQFLKHVKRPNLSITSKGFIVEDDLVVAACDDSDLCKSPIFPKSSKPREQEIISLIHQMNPESYAESATIAFDGDGLVEARILPNGGYEFITKNPGGSQPLARWVPRSGGKAHEDDQGNPLSWFKFLLVNKADKRNYAVASLDRSSMTVLDKHTAASTDSDQADSTEQPEPPLSPSQSTAADKEIVVETSPEVRKLILVTGIWVAISEGWVPSVKAAPAENQPKAGRKRTDSQSTLTTKDLSSSSSVDLPKRRFSQQLLSRNRHRSSTLAAGEEVAALAGSAETESTEEVQSPTPTPAPDAGAGADEETEGGKKSSLVRGSRKMKEKLKLLVDSRRHTV